MFDTRRSPLVLLSMISPPVLPSDPGATAGQSSISAGSAACSEALRTRIGMKSRMVFIVLILGSAFMSRMCGLSRLPKPSDLGSAQGAFVELDFGNASGEKIHLASPDAQRPIR